VPTLRDTQNAFAEALAFGNRAGILSQIASDGFSPDERLDIYRNTYVATLTSALRISYPAVHRLVGAEFFEGAAYRFIETGPPRSAYLNAYGAEFPGFLGRFPAAQSLPYLEDVARLEWAVNIALHAEDAAPMDANTVARLAEVPPDRLILVPHPSIAYLRLDHPAREIWRAVLAEDDAALSAIDVSAGPEWLMVERNATGVEAVCLPDNEWRFAAALCAGETFAHATEASGDIDVPLLFARFLIAGRFTDFRIAGAWSLASSETVP
jgi:hypothetical protein